jgi:hypothetical protein
MAIAIAWYIIQIAVWLLARLVIVGGAYLAGLFLLAAGGTEMVRVVLLVAMILIALVLVVAARQRAVKAWLIKYSFALIFLFGGAAAFLTKSESVRDLWWANPVGQVLGVIACFCVFCVVVFKR